MLTSGWSRSMCATPFGRGDQRDERDAARAGVLEGRRPRRGRVARREHRVEHQHVAVGDVRRQLDVVLDGLERLLVAVEADEPDPRDRDQREHAVEHPHPGAQDRADGDLLARDALGSRALERRLDLDLLDPHLLGRLVGEEQRQLVHEPAEHRRCRGCVAAGTPELVPRPSGCVTSGGRVATGAEAGSRDVGRVPAEARVERPAVAEGRARAAAPRRPRPRASARR